MMVRKIPLRDKLFEIKKHLRKIGIKVETSCLTCPKYIKGDVINCVFRMEDLTCCLKEIETLKEVNKCFFIHQSNMCCELDDNERTCRCHVYGYLVTIEEDAFQSVKPLCKKHMNQKEKELKMIRLLSGVK
jgi:hypothetical protein